MSKISKSELQSRISIIFDMRLDGMNGSQIVQCAAEKGWDVRDRQIYNYIEKADRLIGARQETTRDQKLEKTRKRLERLFSKAISDQDYRLARLVLKDIRELDGLDAKNDAYTREEVLEWWRDFKRIVRAELGEDLANRVFALKISAGRGDDLSDAGEEEHEPSRSPNSTHQYHSDDGLAYEVNA